jgi:glycosyltransferase involved in cell wall biosynthesis
VTLYQSAADVLLFHMSERLTHFEYCTPAKGYEYMAAGRPIVGTDIPLFEEVFGADGERALRVRERTPAAVAGAIRRALDLPDGAREMTDRAQAWIRGRTWQGRADATLERLGL